MENLQTQGISLPRLGLGTYRMQGDVCRAAVESALGLGYRHIDTAEMYGNEDAIGAAIAASKVARRDLHVTTKVWNENLAPDAMRRAFDASLKKLRLDHVDLYLVHWPAKNMNLPKMFETLMKLREEGRTRAIGVANFNIALLKTVVEQIKAPIACNQVEYHVMLDQTPLRKYLKSKSIPLVAYCPLAQGKAASDETLAAIGRKHGASAAQVALKWRDPEGLARGKPKGQSRCAECRARRRGHASHRGVAEEHALCESGVRTGVGLRGRLCGYKQNDPLRGHFALRVRHASIAVMTMLDDNHVMVRMPAMITMHFGASAEMTMATSLDHDGFSACN
jgi:2,5-diketo-D-gluconate reductase B